jgi:outer membrane PBP1 activator LpoA protein
MDLPEVQARRDMALAQVLARGPRGASRADDGARLLAAEWAVEDRDVPRAQRLLDELPPGLARRTQALRLRLQTRRAARQPLQATRPIPGAFGSSAICRLIWVIASRCGARASMPGSPDS